MDLDPQKKLRLDRINKKGWEVSTKLTELLANKDVDLSDFGLFGNDDTKAKKEARLRAFLELINGARKRLLEGDFGACQSCGTQLSDVGLDETPWLEQCNPCAAAKAPLTS